MKNPVLSVIVPVRDGQHYLPASLSALRASQLAPTRWELIVVDDSSRDRSAEVAGRYADRVLRLTDGTRGPAFARNRGAEVARGTILLFVDADVCVHPDVLGRVTELFQHESNVSAVFGTYDMAPAAAGLISQYRNLLHRYVHLRDAGDAVTFWAGCGAIRADVFARCGGFDESPRLHSIEDVELGYRVSAQGHRIVLSPDIQGTHLKRWTLWSMVATDVGKRGIPWMRLLMARRVPSTGTLSIRFSEQVCTVLLGVACATLLAWLWTGATVWIAIVGATLAAALLINAPLLAWFVRWRGIRFAAATIPLRMLYYVLNVVSILIALLTPGFHRQQPLSLSRSPG